MSADVTSGLTTKTHLQDHSLDVLGHLDASALQAQQKQKGFAFQRGREREEMVEGEWKVGLGPVAEHSERFGMLVILRHLVALDDERA
jgi:hypothetical protein